MVTNATYDWNLVYLKQHFLSNSLNHHERCEFAIEVRNHQSYGFFQRLAVHRDAAHLPDIGIFCSVKMQFFRPFNIFILHANYLRRMVIVLCTSIAHMFATVFICIARI